MILKQHNRSDYLCSSVLSTAGLISALDHWNQSLSAPSDSKTWVSAERHDHLSEHKQRVNRQSRTGSECRLCSSICDEWKEAEQKMSKMTER